jgi:hypothetical protein
MHHGVRLSVDFVLRQRSKLYASCKLFLEYINTIFVPCLNELKEFQEFEACEAVLLMDNCSAHVSLDAVAILARVPVRIIKFASDTTHIFQVRDVARVSALNKHATGLETLDEEQSAASFLLKVHHDFTQTTIEVNIWGASAAIGFTYDMKHNPYGLFFDEKKL